MRGKEKIGEPTPAEQFVGEMLLSGNVARRHNSSLPLESKHWNPRIEIVVGSGGEKHKNVVLGEWSKPAPGGIGREETTSHSVDLDEIRTGLAHSLTFEGIKQFGTGTIVLVPYNYRDKVTGDVIASNLLLLTDAQFDDLRRVIEEAGESGE